MSNKNPSSFFTIFSIVLVLLFIGIYGLIAIHAQNVSNILKQNLQVIVELQDSIRIEDRQILQNKLDGLPQVKKGSTKFIPKINAIEFMKTDLGDSYLIESNDNPFSDILVFKMNKEYVDQTNLEHLTTELTKWQGVKDAIYYDGIYDYLGKNISRLSRILLVFGLILSIFAFSLIYSTIYLNLYSERFKIRTMELVGSSWAQIRKPFFVKAVKIALVASIISIAILSTILLFFYLQVDMVNQTLSFGYTFLIFLLLVIFCFLITLSATYFVLNKYLGLSKSEIL